MGNDLIPSLYGGVAGIAPVDETLTKAGEAADAKVVGERLNAQDRHIAAQLTAQNDRIQEQAEENDRVADLVDQSNRVAEDARNTAGQATAAAAAAGTVAGEAKNAADGAYAAAGAAAGSAAAAETSAAAAEASAAAAEDVARASAENINQLSEQIDKQSEAIADRTNTRSGGNIFDKNKHTCQIFYSSGDAIFKEDDRYISIIIPVNPSVDSGYYFYSKYSTFAYRFTSEHPEVGASGDIVLDSYSMTERREAIGQFPKGTKYLHATLWFEATSTYTIDDVLNNTVFAYGTKLYGNIPYEAMTVKKINFDTPVDMMNGRPTVIHYDEREVVGNDFNGAPNLELRNITIEDAYALLDVHLSDCFTKELVGYGGDVNGAVDTLLPIYIYKYRTPLTTCGGYARRKPKILVTSCIHGDEKGGFYCMYKFFDHYFKNDSNLISDILTDIDIDYIPILNPYGFNITNRRNARNVDLNRNFDHNWESISNDDPIYNKGDSAESEVETQLITDFYRNHASEYVWYLDMHNSGKFGGQGYTFMFNATTDNDTAKDVFSRTCEKLHRIWIDTYGADITQQGAQLIDGGLDLPLTINRFGDFNADAVTIVTETSRNNDSKFFTYPEMDIAKDGIFTLLYYVYKNCILTNQQ